MCATPTGWSHSVRVSQTIFTRTLASLKGFDAGLQTGRQAASLSHRNLCWQARTRRSTFVALSRRQEDSLRGRTLSIAVIRGSHHMRPALPRVVVRHTLAWPGPQLRLNLVVSDARASVLAVADMRPCVLRDLRWCPSTLILPARDLTASVGLSLFIALLPRLGVWVSYASVSRAMLDTTTCLGMLDNVENSFVRVLTFGRK